MDEEDDGGENGGEQRTPSCRGAKKEPHGLRDDQEDREVVRRERERGRNGPAHERPAPARAQSLSEEEQADGGEEREEAVRTGLLRVPDEERMNAHERCGDEPRPARDQHRPGAVRHGDDCGAGERRQRAETNLAEAEEARPGPGEHVVEIRRRLALGNRPEQVVEVHAQERHGDELVEPEALAIECREAKDRTDGRQHRDEHDHARAAVPRTEHLKLQYAAET